MNRPRRTMLLESWVIIACVSSFTQSARADGRRYFAFVGDNISLPCESPAGCDVDWTFTGSLSSDEKHICFEGSVPNTLKDKFQTDVVVKPGSCNLIINNVQHEDTGEYLCTVNAGMGSIHTLKLDVYDGSEIHAAQKSSGGVNFISEAPVITTTLREEVTCSCHKDVEVAAWTLVASAVAGVLTFAAGILVKVCQRRCHTHYSGDHTNKEKLRLYGSTSDAEQEDTKECQEPRQSVCHDLTSAEDLRLLQSESDHTEQDDMKEGQEPCQLVCQDQRLPEFKSEIAEQNHKQEGNEQCQSEYNDLTVVVVEEQRLAEFKPRNIHVQRPELIGQLLTNALVWGITELDGNIYVLTYESDTVQVYIASEPFENIHRIVVDGLQQPRDITRYKAQHMLYIADYSACLWEIGPSEAAKMSISKIGLEKKCPQSLSIHSDRLLVVIMDQLLIYALDGGPTLQKNIDLPKHMYAQHAVEITPDTFIVCHLDLKATDDRDIGVTKVDDRGHVLLKYNYQRQGEFLRPWHMAAYTDGSVLVAHQRGRLVLLSPDAEDGRRFDVKLSDETSCQPAKCVPARLHYVQDSGRLFITGDKRVLIYSLLS